MMYYRLHLHPCLLYTSQGTVYAWGDNTYGQLGQNTSGSSSAVLQAVKKSNGESITNAVAVAAAGNYSLALTADGIVYAWGDNTYGVMGNGPKGGIQKSAVAVAGVPGDGTLEGIYAIAASPKTAVAISKDGHVYSWGNNDNGQIGDATHFERLYPVMQKMCIRDRYNTNSYPVLKLTDAVAVGAANSMVYAVMNDRTVKYWSYGSSPTSLIKGESASTSDLFENALEVTGGISHNTILRDDGYVWTWSNGGAEAGNASGQLGNTLRRHLDYPALVVVGESPYNSVYLNNVVEVRSGANHNVALIKEQNENHTQYDVPEDKAFTSKNGYVLDVYKRQQ